MALLIGLNPLARSIAADMQHKGASVILASHHRKAAQDAAKELGCRFIQHEAVYSTLHDILIHCDDEKTDRPKAAADLHVGVIRDKSVIMDLTAQVHKTALLREAALRGCAIVPPLDLLAQHLQLQAKLLTGEDVSAKVFHAAFPDWAQDEE
jgi:shikimate 5-dehydrogenase